MGWSNGATKHLYNWLCPSVGWSVGYAFVRRSTRRTLLAYLALFIPGFHSQIYYDILNNMLLAFERLLYVIESVGFELYS